MCMCAGRCFCYRMYDVRFLYSGVILSSFWYESCALCRDAHTKRSNESCWELVLHSIKETTYLQRVGRVGCGVGWISVTHQPSSTLALLTPGLILSTVQPRVRGGRRETRGKEGMRERAMDDRVWTEWQKTHMHAGCTCVSDHINKYICVETSTCTN